MKQVNFIILKDNFDKIAFDNPAINPGIGGTQFVTINLAMAMATALPDYKILLSNASPLMIPNKNSNLSVNIVNSKEIHQLLIPSAVNILTNTHIRNLDNKINLNDYKIIEWCHHPFDRQSFDFARLRRVIINVGSVSRLTNILPHFNRGITINNLYYPHFNQYTNKLMRDKIKFVYIGALTPQKGFLDVLKMLSDLRNVEYELDVIGSKNLYGQSDDGLQIGNYQKEILKTIELNKLDAKVKFHGILSHEKFKIIQDSHFAILNPTGRSEAYPASIIECLNCSTPVITSHRFGNLDILYGFGGLDLRTHSLQNIIETYIEDNGKYKELRKQCFDRSLKISKLNSLITMHWKEVIVSVSSGVKINKKEISKSYAVALSEFKFRHYIRYYIKVFIYMIHSTFWSKIK